MGDYLHLAWTLGTLGGALSGPAIAAAKAAGFRAAEETGVHWLGVAGPRAPAVRTRRADPLCLIGEVFDLSGPPGRSDQVEADRIAELCRSSWGRYVVLSRRPDGRVRSVFRDPSGAFEAFVWDVDSLQVVTSSTPDWLIAAANPRARVRTARLAALIADPSAIVGATALDGILDCGAGDWLDLERGERVAVWRPARRPPFEGTVEEAATALEAAVDRAALRLSAGVASAAAELSGGLDSAIVSRALARAGARVGSWINSYTDRPESDERDYARQVAAALRGELVFTPRGASVLDESVVDATAGEPRPSLNGQDIGFDRSMAEICRAAGVEALFTGKGGDAIFLHAVDGDVFTDLRRAAGWRAPFSPLLPALSRWTRTSAWSILHAASRSGGRAGAGTRGSPDRTGLLTVGLAPVASDHPWLQDLDDLGPAKTRHVAAVVGNLGFQTRCRRNAAVDMIHPLTAQPVVELCLSMPTWILATGGRDRGLARRAFAGRLPPEIVERRSKGDYTAFFHRETAANLPFLREYLLDGRLAALRILDRSALEAGLDLDRLIWTGGPPDLSRALVVEAWIRRWERRST